MGAWEGISMRAKRGAGREKVKRTTAYVAMTGRRDVEKKGMGNAAGGISKKERDRHDKKVKQDFSLAHRHLRHKGGEPSGRA